MSTLSQLGADTDRIRALVTAHRHTQAEHRGALAAESPRALAAAAQRSQALFDALSRAGATELADQLHAEARAGTRLIVALTSYDADDHEVKHALGAYLHHRGIIDAAIAGPPLSR